MEDDIFLNSKKLIFVSEFPEITIADSFVKRPNKIGSASGEAKLYIGHDCNDLWDFFGPPNFEIDCFILKSNLISIHNFLKHEYQEPKQKYRYSSRKLLSELWSIRDDKISQFPDILEFLAFEQSQIRGNRIYIKSDSNNFDFIREVSLPNLTLLRIRKYINPLGHHYFNFNRVANN